MPKIKLFINRLLRDIRGILMWFTPGIGVKRWFVITLIGITLLAVGAAYFLLDFYRTSSYEQLLPLLDVLSLRSFPRPVRVVIFLSLGLGISFFGIWRLNIALLNPFLRKDRRLVEQIVDFRKKNRGSKVVVMGGGHGMATLLRGLKKFTHNLTAVVTVADDGGSSGMLRRSLGILPPGDIRNCLAALSNDEDLLGKLFQYRFSDDSGLGGHSFGNLFISALADLTGSFEAAVSESGSVLGVHGTVLPATLENVQLIADIQYPDLPNEVRVIGESSIPNAGGKIRRVHLEPNNPSAYPPVINQILNADMIVVGPGSLFTSLLPNMLVPEILSALKASSALKVFVVNIATQKGETIGFSIQDHIKVIEEQIGKGVFTIFVANNNYERVLPEGVSWVKPEVGQKNPRLYFTDLTGEEQLWRHDPDKLATTLMNLLYERTGPLLG